MSILRKVNITHEYVDPKPDDFKRDFCPYHANLLNALEETSKRKYTEGKLTEITDRYWEFTYTNNERRKVKLTLQLTDEFLNEAPERGSGFARPKSGPKFK